MSSFIASIEKKPHTRWVTNIFDDEVVHRPINTFGNHFFISEFPFVDGYFYTFITDDASYVRAGPFETFQLAYSAWRLMK